jgi:hypothetical protein
MERGVVFERGSSYLQSLDVLVFSQHQQWPLFRGPMSPGSLVQGNKVNKGSYKNS